MSHRRRVVVAVLLSTAAVSGAARAEARACSPASSEHPDDESKRPPPPPDDKVAPALLALRADLLAAERSDALAHMKVYRPLCDADGYPLVGNLATKSPGLQPSAFCAAVRVAEHTDAK
ncbi:MAG: hypothetical protein U1F43_02480 [Myxococcota bacterium]